MKRKLQNNQSGQGLLETIISLGIIGSGIIGMLSLTRHWRDSNWLGRSVWDQGLESGTDYTAAPLFDKSANIWVLDFTADSLTHNYTRLWREGGVYFQSTAATPAGATLTFYRRLLQLDEICADKTVVTSGAACPGGNPKIGIKVQSIVEWQSKENTQQLVMEEQLFNWR